MSKRDIKKVYAPLFNVPVTFVCGFDAARKLGLEPEPHWDAMANTYDGEVFLTVSENNINMIAHESVHCAWRILDLAGVEVDADNHETLAYMTGWIVETAKEFFDKHYSE